MLEFVKLNVEDPLRTFLTEFQGLGFKMHLHGSRDKWYGQWFNKAPEGTDWDYAAQHDEGLKQHLEQTGWEDISARMEYPDQDTVTVWEKFYGKEKVQVSLRKDLDRYLAVWYRLPVSVYGRLIRKDSPAALDKQQRAEFFDAMFSIYDAGLEYKFRKEDLL